jgi:hypothetical protein
MNDTPKLNNTVTPIDTAALLDFLRGKLAKAEESLQCRIEGEKCWRGGTAEEWKQVAKMNGGKVISKSERTELAEREKRIAVKCRHEVEMFKAEIAALGEHQVEADNLTTPTEGVVGVDVHRLVLPLFEWGGDKYPVIADLQHGYKLVAHKNAPAITDGNLFSTLTQHHGDHEDLTHIKRVAYDKFEKWAWELLRPRLECPTYGQNVDVLATAGEWEA